MRPIDYIPLVGDLDYEVVTGHITQAEFDAVIRFECGLETPARLEPVRHAYGAKLQTSHARSEGWDFEFRLYSERGRGRFPVTVGYRAGSVGFRSGTPVDPLASHMAECGECRDAAANAINPQPAA